MDGIYVDMSEQAIEKLKDRGLFRLCDQIARMTRDEIKLFMEDAPPRTGRVYLKPGTQTEYTASAPGEPPAVREARYRDGWMNTRPVDFGSKVVAAVYNEVTTENGEYLIGDLLEHGTQDLVNYGVRMEPRPHIRPALDAVVPKVEDLVKRAVA